MNLQKIYKKEKNIKVKILEYQTKLGNPGKLFNEKKNRIMSMEEQHESQEKVLLVKKEKNLDIQKMKKKRNYRKTAGKRKK